MQQLLLDVFNVFPKVVVVAGTFMRIAVDRLDGFTVKESMSWALG